jgi:hypothetical protein
VRIVNVHGRSMVSMLTRGNHFSVKKINRTRSVKRTFGNTTLRKARYWLAGKNVDQCSIVLVGRQYDGREVSGKTLAQVAHQIKLFWIPICIPQAMTMPAALRLPIRMFTILVTPSYNSNLPGHLHHPL